TIAAVLFALLAVAGLTWGVRGRVLGPLEEVRHSLAAVARGDWRTPGWGTGRPGEVGDLGRVVGAFRPAARHGPGGSLLSGRGRYRFKSDGESSDLFEPLAQSLNGTAERLTESGAATAELVTAARRDLTVAMSQVQQLCAAVARSASDSNREIR